MSFKVTVPEGWRKRHNRTVLPAYGGSSVVGMMDDSLNDHKRLWRRVGGEFVLDADDLPSAETYLVTMEGLVSKSALDRFVYIKPAANRTTDDTGEKYWLESGLRNPRTLESVYDDLEVDDINLNASVSIDKMFGLAIPQDIQERARPWMASAARHFAPAGRPGSMPCDPTRRSPEYCPATTRAPSGGSSTRLRRARLLRNTSRWIAPTG